MPVVQVLKRARSRAPIGGEGGTTWRLPYGKAVVENGQGDELLNERVVCKTLGDERTLLQLLERMVRAIEEGEGPVA